MAATSPIPANQDRPSRIFFEPWGLGDTLIAAAAFREQSGSSALACKPQWHALLRAALAGQPNLLSVDVAYTTTRRRHAFDLSAPLDPQGPAFAKGEVLSIRGDVRDWMMARKLFPGATVRMSGWIQFVPHYSRLADAPFAARLLPVRNRYRAWARLAGVPFAQMENTYRRLQERAPASGKIVLHVGASRRSRQYPHVHPLRELLRGRGYDTELITGPHDPLPEHISEDEVRRVVDQDLVDVLRSARLVITNDSGPMHLAALLGCRTLAIARVTNIAEWLPPVTQFAASERMPRGYRMDPGYKSDDILDAWPGTGLVTDMVEEILAPGGGAAPP